MEKFKIDLFENEYNKPFPRFREVKGNECEIILKKIITKLNKNIKPLDVVPYIRKKSNIMNNYNAKNNFSLKECLSSINIIPNEQTFINWYRFDEIDEFNFADIENYFEDIWFSEVDDIEIFDNSLKWILSISHAGLVFIIE